MSTSTLHSDKSRVEIARPAYAVAIAVAVIALILSAIGFLDSEWLQNRLRDQIIAAIERESGATVLMKSFRLDWRSQTVRIDGLALTGPQKNAEMAFLSAETLIAKFHIISLLRRDVRLTELDIQRPEIHVIMRRDGTTNLGFLKSSRLRSRLVYLRAGIIHIRDGSLDVGSRRSPLAFSGQDLSAVIRCEAEHAGCVVETSIRDLRIIDYPRLNGRLESAISLGPNELVVRSVHWTSGQSEMRLSGRVTSFAERNVQFQVQGRVAGPDLGLRDLGGVFTVDGSGSYRGMDEWNFDGRAQARNVEIQKTPVDASAQLTADARGIEFRQLQIYSSGSKFLGSGKLEKFRDLAVRGRVERLDLHRVALLFSEYSIPWTGALNGPVGVQAQVEMQGHTLNFHDLAVRGDLTITPSTGAIPISGQLTGQYSERTKELTLSKADVALPHSRAAFTGVAGKQLAGSFESTDLQDLKPLVPTYELPAIKSGGTAAFDGTLSGASGDLRVAGNVHLAHASWRGWDLDDARASFDATSTGIRFGSLSLAGPTLQATGSGDIELQNWSVSPNASLSTRLHVAKADLAQLFVPYLPPGARDLQGSASGTFDVKGHLDHPYGRGNIEISKLQVFGEQVTKLEASVEVSGSQVTVSNGRLHDGLASLLFSAGYQRSGDDWRNGRVQLKADSNPFPLAVIDSIHRYNPTLNAQTELHAKVTASIRPGHFDLLQADGSLSLQKLSVENTRIGDFAFRGRTDGQVLETNISGRFEATDITGNAEVRLIEGNPIRGQLQFAKIDLGTLRSVFSSGSSTFFPLNGSVAGSFVFDGELEHPSAMQVRAHLNDLELRSKVAATEIAFKSAGPIEIDAAGGEATIRDFRLNGRGTDLAVAGSFPYFRGARPGRVSAKGTVDLAMVQAFTAQVQSSGLANVALELTGNPWNPKASGTITVKDASLASSNFPSDLTGLNGTIEFNQTKASIQKLTAQTGGGRITFGGFVNYGAGPIVYSLNAAAEEVRIRSAGGLSVTATSQLQLTGTSERSMLSGSTTISRVLLNSNMDLGTLLASIATPAVAPGNEKDLLTGMQFDVSIESAPDLQVSTAFSSDVEADIDLRLRGTRDHPTLLGSIFANEGDVKVFGTRYSINRGEVSFVNAARIEPVLNLDVQTEVRGIVVDITIAGPVGRLNVNYRSDPPLLPRDIIALLTVGRTPEPASNIPSSQNTNEVTSLQAGGNTLLGQALTPSNRLSKLFGITNIRIDPMVQGLTAVPQARLTLEQQLSKQISVTYVTNLSQTSEQIFRVEWTFSPHYSLVILRDDNGEFGLDIQYRKRFK